MVNRGIPKVAFAAAVARSVVCVVGRVRTATGDAGVLYDLLR